MIRYSKPAPKADGLQFVAAPTAANSPKKKKEDGDQPADTVAPVPLAAKELIQTCGVVEHGLFCGMTTAVIIAGKDGISMKEAAVAVA